LIQADHAAEQAEAAAASGMAKDYEKKLLEGFKAKAVGAKDNGKGAAAEKGKAVLTPKQSELQEAEKALMDDLKHQEELDKKKV